VIEPTIKDQILRDLDRLSPELQRRALELVRGLAAPSLKGASVDDLLSLSGTLDNESAREMREAIEEHCERIDPRDW
jgi:hypothetical protein